MAWRMRVTRYTSNDAEIAVHCDYFDSDDPRAILWHEEATFPPGSSDAKIREELKARGRSARALAGRARPKSLLLGEEIPIDG